ncbi:MAG: M1 family peptidase, partial [Bdellovibrionia bacterium]
MRIDPHSYADDTQPTVHDLDWKAFVDFEKHVIRAQASLRFLECPKTDSPLDLDTRGLTLNKVTDLKGRALKFELGAMDEVLGQRLRVDIPAGSEGVVIDYETSPNASALQWLTP